MLVTPLSFDNIAWAALARQLPTVAVVCLVCSLGTSMDVMAIQTEVPWELDTDVEITALGVGNLLAGVIGLGGPGANPPWTPPVATRPCPETSCHSSHAYFSQVDAK